MKSKCGKDLFFTPVRKPPKLTVNSPGLCRAGEGHAIFLHQHAFYCFLLQAFHCGQPAARHLSCLPLLLSLLTYEVYYSSEAAEGDAAPQVQYNSRWVQVIRSSCWDNLVENNHKVLFFGVFDND